MTKKSAENQTQTCPRYTLKVQTRTRIAGVFTNEFCTEKVHNQSRKPTSSLGTIRLKTRRPLWKDLMLAGMTTVGMWGLFHVSMNYSAFAQIAEFKYETLKASVVEGFSSTSPRLRGTGAEMETQLVKKRPEPFKNPKVKPRDQAKKMFAQMPVRPSDNRLVIPRIGKNVPLVGVPDHKNWNQLETNIQSGLRDGVVVHPISHAPGNFGNFFLTGHSSYYAWDNGRYKDVFALLHEVKEGDIVEVYWEGKQYRYRMKRQKVVPPTEVSVLDQPADESIITLMTCTPVGTNEKRLIWVGELLES